MDLEGVKMFLSKRPNGVYYVYYHDIHGNRKSVSTKATHKKDAYKFLTGFKDIIDTENSKPTKPIDLKTFRFEFLKHSEAVHSPKTTKTYITTFKYLLGFLGNIQLSEISDRNIRAYIDFRIKNPSLFQARKDLINIGSCLNWALQENYLLANPCLLIKKIKVPPKLPIFFSKHEFTKLISIQMDDELKAMIQIAVNTGLREMELLTLRWNQISFNESILILDNRTHITKSKKIRTIPLNRIVLDVLGRLYSSTIKGELVFKFEGITNREKYVQNNFRKYVKLAGVNSKLNFHSLRHTFASWLVQAGVSIYEVSKLLGHADIKTTQIYAHLRDDDLRRAVNLLD